MLPDKRTIASNVNAALQEDIGSGDLTAALIPPETQANASLIAREKAVLAGRAWFDNAFQQLDESITLHWHAHDGDHIKPAQQICDISGPARPILTAERTAINFLQTLSATATMVAHYVALLRDSDCKILDTRKTIPGLRQAQKYAVSCGGGFNHRTGLYDAILIKENHILAAGSISAAISKAREKGDVPIEVEVESLDELRQALAANPDQILLDNFSLIELKKAVGLNQGQCKLEAR